jgi:hypothetical protein
MISHWFGCRPSCLWHPKFNPIPNWICVNINLYIQYIILHYIYIMYIIYIYINTLLHTLPSSLSISSVFHVRLNLWTTVASRINSAGLKKKTWIPLKSIHPQLYIYPLLLAMYHVLIITTLPMDQLLNYSISNTSILMVPVKRGFIPHWPYIHYGFWGVFGFL